MCLSTSNQTPPASLAVNLHPVKLSWDSLAVTFVFGRKVLLSSLQRPATFCVCNQPKIFPVLLTPSSTRSLPEWCIYSTLSKSSPLLTVPREPLLSASQQSVTSTCRSNSNTVCSDIYKLPPICPLISSSHGCLKFTSLSLRGKQGDDTWCGF